VTEPTHAFETLTVKQAEALLGKNEANRSIRQQKVDQYARDMTNGHWDLCTAPLVIDTNGNLIDGQHRLTAQVKAGVKIKWLVMRNVDPDLQKTIDTGVSRTASDALHFAGESNTQQLAVVLRLLWRIKNGTLTGKRSENISINDLLDTLEENPVIRFCLAEAMETRGKMTHISPNILAIAHWLIMQENGIDEASAFLRRIAILTGEKPGSPVLALHRRITEIQRNQIRVRPRDILYLVMKAWNYDAAGEKVNKLALYSKTGEYSLPKTARRTSDAFVPTFSDEDEDTVDEVEESGIDETKEGVAS
jgi:hypothetical protein